LLQPRDSLTEYIVTHSLRHSLMTWGEKFSKSEADNILAEAPSDGKGNIDIKKFAQILTRGDEEEGAGA
jgi:Ca2+-binding EF-hand superfamily protein